MGTSIHLIRRTRIEDTNWLEELVGEWNEHEFLTLLGELFGDPAYSQYGMFDDDITTLIGHLRAMQNDPHLATERGLKYFDFPDAITIFTNALDDMSATNAIYLIRSDW